MRDGRIEAMQHGEQLAVQCMYFILFTRAGFRCRAAATHCWDAGSAARAAATAFTTPISLIKTKMEATGSYMLAPGSNIAAVARAIVRERGMRGLWRGMLPTILSNAPFSGIYYCVYNELKKTAAKRFDAPVPVMNFGAGVIAAMAATLATQPTDVVRAWVQLGASGGFSDSTTQLRRHGGRVLMSGATPRFLKRSLQTALVWTLYEEIMPLLTAAFALSESQQQHAQAAKQ